MREPTLLHWTARDDLRDLIVERLEFYLEDDIEGWYRDKLADDILETAERHGIFKVIP